MRTMRWSGDSGDSWPSMPDRGACMMNGMKFSISVICAASSMTTLS